MSHWRHRILNKLPNIMQILLLICSDTKGSILGTILYKHSWTENCSTIDNLSFRNVSEKTRKYQRMEKSRELLVEVEGQLVLCERKQKYLKLTAFKCGTRKEEDILFMTKLVRVSRAQRNLTEGKRKISEGKQKWSPRGKSAPKSYWKTIS